MLLTTDLQSPLSERSTSRISMFFVMPSFSGRLVRTFIFLSTWLTHVVFCLPGEFLTGFMKDLSASRAGVLTGKHIRWTNHANNFLCMVIVHGFISVSAYWSLFESVFGHLTLLILLSSFLWSESMLFSRVCVNVLSSELYIRYFGCIMQIILSWVFYWHVCCWE